MSALAADKSVAGAKLLRRPLRRPPRLGLPHPSLDAPLWTPQLEEQTKGQTVTAEQTKKDREGGGLRGRPAREKTIGWMLEIVKGYKT